MESTSKYIQLNQQILLEYRYSDPQDPENISTDANGAKLFILNNTYTESNYIFNEDNPFIETNNYRYRTSIPVDSNKDKYAYLTSNNVLNYLDYDENLIDLNGLLDQENSIPNIPVQSPIYDTIRLHMISGFSFEGLGEGFIFEVKVKDKTGKRHNLSSITYRPTDSYEILNPSPFISNERLYSSYIEIKIPALSWLTDTYISNPNDQDILANQLTNNIGFNVQNTIDLSIKYIANTINENGQIYFIIGETTDTSINKSDEYSNLNAIIEESSAGDYFEVYGSYNGDIYEDFIVNENNKPDTDIIVVHDIVVEEQVSSSFIKTSEHSFIQTGEYDKPYIFRPVIINSHIATSYRLNYTLRVLNKVDNSQVIRNSVYSSFNVKKYGKKFKKINLGTSPIITKIYNKINETNNLPNNLNYYNSFDTSSLLSKTDFVIGFNERINVSASVSNVKTEFTSKQEGDVVKKIQGDKISDDKTLKITSNKITNKIYEQNEGEIIISPFDDFIKFVFYNDIFKDRENKSYPILMDLTKMGKFYINFIDDETGDEIRIPNYTNIKDINKSRGEVVFKINKSESKKILKFSSKSFYISSRLEDGDNKSNETLMYIGKWLKPSDKFSKIASDEISELKKEIIKLKEDLVLEKQTSEELIVELEQKLNSDKKDYVTSKNETISNKKTQKTEKLISQKNFDNQKGISAKKIKITP